MFILFFIGLGLVIWFLVKNSKTVDKTQTIQADASVIVQRDRMWLSFLKTQYDQTTSKAHKKHIEELYDKLLAQGLYVPADLALTPNTAVGTPSHSLAAPQQIDSISEEVQVQAEQNPKIHGQQLQLDNASLLLYFGAFLFVASAGLFVAFSGVVGELRTLIVLIVALTMYSGGIWLFQNKKKFVDAGIAFAGIGLSVLPLVGLAAYSYVFNQTEGPLVWFITSVLCLGVYIHALKTIRKPLINYLVIFTLLSLFQSAVAIVDAPIYYFGWMLTLVGLIMSAINQIYAFDKDFTESSDISSQLFVPVSLLVSVALLPTEGLLQLGISLLLSAAYYLLQSIIATDKQKVLYGVITQVLLLSSLTTLTFAITDRAVTTAVAISIASALQLLLIMVMPRMSERSYAFASVAFAGQLVGILSASSTYSVLLVNVLVLFVLGTVIWLRQKRNDAYAGAVLAMVSVPVIVGQLLIDPALTGTQQSTLLLLPLFVQLLAIFSSKQIQKMIPEFEIAALQLYVFTAGLIGVASFFADGVSMIIICSIVAVATITIAEKSKHPIWAEMTGLFLLLPLLRGPVDGANLFLGGLLVALFCNIGLAIRYRSELNRWTGTLLWLVLPIGLGVAKIGGGWSELTYAWMYTVTTVGLLVARSIARGRLLLSSKVPVASLSHNASVSYVVGYCLSIGATTLLALSLSDDALQGTILLSFMALSLWILLKYIERDSTIAASLPIYAQLIVWSLLRPSIKVEQELTLFLFCSSILAAGIFLIAYSYKRDKVLHKSLLESAILTSLITPLSALFTSQSLLIMPIGLFVTVALSFVYFMNRTQAYREFILGGALGALWWMLWIVGVREAQVYAHSLVALLVLYAYWRSIRKENKESDSYVTASLATATIPLAVQALGSNSGGLYGWWLLLEQIGILLVGMSLNRPFMIKWGLYVALGAILYQLRDLGWAALTVLALFIIGLAVYKIQKYGDNERK